MATVTVTLFHRWLTATSTKVPLTATFRAFDVNDVELEAIEITNFIENLGDPTFTLDIAVGETVSYIYSQATNQPVAKMRFTWVP